MENIDRERQENKTAMTEINQKLHKEKQMQAQIVVDLERKVKGFLILETAWFRFSTYS